MARSPAPKQIDDALSNSLEQVCIVHDKVRYRLDEFDQSGCKDGRERTCLQILRTKLAALEERLRSCLLADQSQGVTKSILVNQVEASRRDLLGYAKIQSQNAGNSQELVKEIIDFCYNHTKPPSVTQSLESPASVLANRNSVDVPRREARDRVFENPGVTTKAKAQQAPSVAGPTPDKSSKVQNGLSGNGVEVFKAPLKELNGTAQPAQPSSVKAPWQPAVPGMTVSETVETRSSPVLANGGPHPPPAPALGPSPEAAAARGPSPKATAAGGPSPEAAAARGPSPKAAAAMGASPKPTAAQGPSPRTSAAGGPSPGTTAAVVPSPQTVAANSPGPVATDPSAVSTAPSFGTTAASTGTTAPSSGATALSTSASAPSTGSSPPQQATAPQPDIPAVPVSLPPTAVENFLPAIRGTEPAAVGVVDPYVVPRGTEPAAAGVMAPHVVPRRAAAVAPAPALPSVALRRVPDPAVPSTLAALAGGGYPAGSAAAIKRLSDAFPYSQAALAVDVDAAPEVPGGAELTTTPVPLASLPSSDTRTSLAMEILTDDYFPRLRVEDYQEEDRLSSSSGATARAEAELCLRHHRRRSFLGRVLGALGMAVSTLAMGAIAVCTATVLVEAATRQRERQGLLEWEAVALRRSGDVPPGTRSGNTAPVRPNASAGQG